MPDEIPFLCRRSTDLVERLLRERPGVVIDIGAHQGGYFGYWLEHGASRVIGFEPVPWHYEKAYSRWADDRRVDLHCLAVGEKAEEVRDALVYNCHTIAVKGQTPLEEAAENKGRHFNFSVVSLDAWLEQNGPPWVAMVKLDVDGYEPAALRGMRGLLLGDKPPIMLELSGLPKAFGEDCGGMIQGLYDHGYYICTMTGEVCETPAMVMQHYPWHTSFDVMAVPTGRIGANWPRI